MLIAIESLCNPKQVPGFPDYWATPDGKVYSRFGKGRPKDGVKHQLPEGMVRELIGGTHKFGYRQIMLHRSGKRHSRLAQIVILETFVSPRPKGAVCRHLDGNPKNNALCNLAWGTTLENIQDKLRHGTQERGESHHGAKLTEAKVKEIRKMLKDGHKQKDIAMKFRVTRSAIGGISTRKLWKHVY